MSNSKFKSNGNFNHHLAKEFLQAPKWSRPHNFSRGYGFFVARLLKGALRVRYLILGGAIGGGMTLNKRYEEWKDGLPDIKWLNDLMPDNDQWSKFSKDLFTIKEAVKDSIEIGKLCILLVFFHFLGIFLLHFLFFYILCCRNYKSLKFYT